MAVFTLNSIEVKVPDSLTVTVNDIDDGAVSVRSSDGTLNRARVATKRQVQVEWGVLTMAEMSEILLAVADLFVPVYYPDPVTGTFLTKTMYVGNRPATAMIIIGPEVFWEGLKITLIER